MTNNIPGSDGPSDPKRPPCKMYDVTFRTTGAENTFTEGGRYPWRDKVYPSWWPVVWGWSFFGPTVGDEAAIEPLLGVGFVQTQDPALANQQCAWQIFFDLIPALSLAPATPATPSAVNTNFGNGWIVPAMDGLPMDLLVVIDKAPGGAPAAAYSGCFNMLWSYERIGTLR